VERGFQRIAYDFLKFSLIAFLLLIAGTYFLVQSNLPAVGMAYLLSFLFVSSNFFLIRKIRGDEQSKFYRQFFITLAVRFVLIIAALVVVLTVIKIHQIYFTVSFIISYIFHSVIEIISIQKLLETDN
jgi:O-antigen/teichoic acid export membrane protein